MSDQTNNDAQDTSDNSEGANWRRDLEARYKAEKSRADAAEKSLAFGQVKGLDLSNPAHAYFAKTYDGPFKAEDIQRAATENGFLVDAQAAAQQEAVAQQSQFDAASNGAASDGVPGSDAAKLEALLNGNYSSAADYEKAVREAGFAKNLLNG